MGKHLRLFLLAASVLPLLYAACDGTRSPATPGLDKSQSGFNLHIWEDSFLGNTPQGSFVLDIEKGPHSAVARVRAERISGLKALYFDLSYDSSRFAPVSAQLTPEFGAADRLLSLSVLSQADKVYCGAILIHPGEQAGFSGEGVLAEVRFRALEGAAGSPGPAPKQASAAPVSNGSRAPLRWEAGTGRLHWNYFNQGDYDQNGIVTISDLTPLGVNFGEQSAELPKPFPEISALSAVDGDGNGELNLGDLTPIGMYFNASAVAGYEIYASPNLSDYPASNSEPPSFAPLDTEATPGMTPQGERLNYLHVVQNPQPNVVYWVRPVDGEGGVGTPSNMAGGNPADCATLSLDDPPGLGTGTLLDPYIAYSNDIFQFSLLDAANANVTTSPDARYHVGDGAAGWISNTDAHLHVLDTFSGYFTVWAEYQGVQANNTIWFKVPDASQLPVAALTTTLNPVGHVPLTVEFDASGSSDPDGTIVKYEFDDNGPMFGWSWFDNGNDPTLQVVYNSPLDYQCYVRVTDNDGYTAMASTWAAPFEVSTELVNDGVPQANVVGKYCSLAEINYQPGISYFDETNGDLLYSYYVVPPAPDPPVWQTCLVDSGGVVGKGTSLVADDTYKLAYIAYYDQTNHALKFARATKEKPAAQADWVIHTVDAGPDVGMGPSLCLLDGYPMIAYEDAQNSAIKFAQAGVQTPSSAADWAIHTIAPVDVPYSSPCLRAMGDLPALTFYDPASYRLKYARALVAHPASAADWLVLLADDSVAAGGQHSLDTLVTYLGGGNYEYSPMIGYFDWTNGNLRCMFGSAKPVGPAEFNSCLIQALNPPVLALICRWGKPAVAFVDPSNSSLRMARAFTVSEARNGRWFRYTLDQTRQVGGYISLTDISFGFGVAYFDQGAGGLCYAWHSDTISP